MMRISAKLQSLTTLNSCFTTVRFNSQLFVSKLSFYTKDEDLHSMFSPFGVVKEARLVMDRATGRPKGFGFVTFETESQAQDAVKAMDGRIVQGRLIFVEFAKKI